MEGMILLLVLAVLAVPVLLVVALVMIADLRRRVGELERHGQAQVAPAAVATQTPADAPPPAAAAAQADTMPADATRVPDGAARVPAAGGAPDPEKAAWQPRPGHSHGPAAPAPSVVPVQPPVASGSRAPAMAKELDGTGLGSAAAAPVGSAGGRPAPPHAAAAERSLEDLATARVLRWFTTGNVIAKVGMLVLLAGVAALLKYAADQGWLAVPIGWRLAGVAAVALAGLGFGWRQRGARRAFALTLQGGAIGVLLLVVYAAFQLYALVPAVPAFALSVALVAVLCTLAVLQESRTMAIFGIFAGFMAPLWLSTGTGSHVVLFSYYALFNLGVLAMAWLRPWRELNLLGFAFTWGIGVTWGALRYDPAHYATVQPFLLLFFAFYLAIPLLYLRLRRGHGYDRVDGALVFGTPLVAFPLQAALLDGAPLPLAQCALGLATMYALLAWRMLPSPRWRAMGMAKAVLATGFATLAVPLAFSARVTACLFALEGAAMIWLGLRQGRRLPQAAGVALQLAAALAFLVAFDGGEPAQMFANPVYLAALLIALSGLASAWAFRDGGRHGAALAAYLWGIGWWLAAGLAEIDGHVPDAWALHAQATLLVATAWLAAEARRFVAAPALATTVAAMFGLVLLVTLRMDGNAAHPLAAGGWWAWVAFVLAGGRALWCLRADGGRVAALAQALWWLAWPLAATLSAWHLTVEAALPGGWRWACATLPWLFSAAVAVWRWGWLRLPLGQEFDTARPGLQSALFAGLGLGWLMGLGVAGDAAPLPWLPLLNPLEAVQALAWVLFARWALAPGQAPASLAAIARPLCGALLFVLLSSVVLRAVHHWTGVPWSHALWGDGVAQTGITVLWSLLGMAAWITGSRRGERGLWRAGAILLGVVLAKLVLVDWHHLGNLPGILSFIAYGVLCLAVGYFAPAPPRQAGAPAADGATAGGDA